MEELEQQVEEEKDEHGKLDINTASAAAVAGAGLSMQKQAIQSLQRTKAGLDEAELVAIQTKTQLQAQNEKLMVIDESLNRIDKASVRLKKMGSRLKKGLQADKLHCFCSACICLNIVILIILLFTTIGGDKKVQDVKIY